MHSITVLNGADVVWHQVIFLKLVVQVWNARFKVHQSIVQKGQKSNSLSEALLLHKLLLVSLTDKTSLSKQSSPQLDSNNTKNEEDEEAEEKDIPKHWQGIQQQHHQDSHTLNYHYCI